MHFVTAFILLAAFAEQASSVDSGIIKPTNCDTRRVPCAPKVMMTIDISSVNKHLPTLVEFLKDRIFYDGAFDTTKDVLGISTYFQTQTSYQMRALWGQYENLEDVRRDLDTFKIQPNTQPGLTNALHDLWKSWPDNSTDTRFVLFTASTYPPHIRKAVDFLKGIKQRGQLTVITLGRSIDRSGTLLLKKEGANVFEWLNPDASKQLPNYRKIFWEEVYGCKNGGGSLL